MRFHVSKKEVVNLYEKLKPLVICLIFLTGIIIPLYINSKKILGYDSLILLLTSIGSISTIITTIIALKLYDRFGIRSNFKTRQTEKVLQLIELLRSLYLYLQSSPYEYIFYCDSTRINDIKSLPGYKIDKSKKIISTKKYFESFIEQIAILKGDQWLPEEIVKKMDLFSIYGVVKISDPFDKQFVRLRLNRSEEDNLDFFQPFPEITFEEFLHNFNDLISEIDSWLSEHSMTKFNIWRK